MFRVGCSSVAAALSGMCHSGLQGSWYPKVQLVTKEAQLASPVMVSDPIFQDQT